MPKPKNEPGDHQEEEVGGQGRGDRPNDHDHGDRDVDLLPTDHVRDAAEDESANERAENGCTGDPTRLQRAQMPLDRHEGGHGPDDEQVVGVGEESDARDDDGASMELAGWGLVQEIGDSWRRGGGAGLGATLRFSRRPLNPPRSARSLDLRLPSR